MLGDVDGAADEGHAQREERADGADPGRARPRLPLPATPQQGENREHEGGAEQDRQSPELADQRQRQADEPERDDAQRGGADERVQPVGHGG